MEAEDEGDEGDSEEDEEGQLLTPQVHEDIYVMC